MRRGGRSGTGTAELRQASFELNIEEAVQDGVDCAVEQCQRLGQGVDGVGDDVTVLGPDVDQMNDEVRSPASDKRTDYAQRHLAHTHQDHVEVSK